MFAMSRSLEQAISRFRTQRPEQPETTGRISAATFRAAIELRLRNLEREFADVKGRLNGLIFVVIGAVITQLILKVVQ
jgi:hypothetical protein